MSDDPAPRLTQHDVHWDHIALHGDCNFLAIVEANVDLLAKQADDLRNELNQVRGSVGGLQTDRLAVGNDFDFVATLERELLVLTRVIQNENVGVSRSVNGRVGERNFLRKVDDRIRRQNDDGNEELRVSVDDAQADLIATIDGFLFVAQQRTKLELEEKIFAGVDAGFRGVANDRKLDFFGIVETNRQVVCVLKDWNVKKS